MTTRSRAAIGAVGAVDHGGVDAADALRGGAHGHRRVAAGQDDDLLARQLEVVDPLEGRQRRGALDELGRAGELDGARPLRQAARNPPSSRASRARARSPRTAMSQVLLAGARSSQTSLFFSRSSRFTVSKADAARLPGRIVLHAVEEGAVAGVFRIDVDLAGEERRAHHLGRPELDPVLDGNALPARARGRSCGRGAPPSVSIFEATTTLSRVCAALRRCRDGEEARPAAA